jgi:hypothetical protein
MPFGSDSSSATLRDGLARRDLVQCKQDGHGPCLAYYEKVQSRLKMILT